MASLNIPQEHIEKLELYVKLPEKVKEMIIQEIKNSEIGENYEEFTLELSKTTSISNEDLLAIIIILINLISAKNRMESEGLEFYSLLKNGLENQKTNLSVNEIIESLKDIDNIENENALATTDAYEMMTSHQRVFKDISINNDVRPIILNKKNNAKLIGAVITYDLKITYKEDGIQKNFHIALDADDLLKLSTAIELAQEHTELIKENSGIKILEV